MIRTNLLEFRGKRGGFGELEHKARGVLWYRLGAPEDPLQGQPDLDLQVHGVEFPSKEPIRTIQQACQCLFRLHRAPTDDKGDFKLERCASIALPADSRRLHQHAEGPIRGLQET